jgi:hypothetical protein
LGDLKNGELLAVAATTFEVLLTVDKKMKREQNLTKLPVAVIVLDGFKNTPAALAPFAPHVEIALTMIRPGQMIEISATGAITVIAPSGA